MSETEAPKDQTVSTRYQRWFLLALALIITVGFYRVVEPFVLSVFMAAILAGMTYPFYRWLVKKTRDRGRTSAVLTILALLFLIILPTIFFVGMVANQALSVSESVGPWVQEQADNPGSLEIRVDG
jgi:predicted PurR-regulated permease PerM